MSDAPEAGPAIRRLVGVYDADGTLRGELAYWVGARLGRAHCALCDITHGLVREKDQWQTCRMGLPVPFDTYHRDDQPAEVRAALAGRSPAVLAEADVGYVLLLDGDELESCHGSPEALVAAIEAAVEQLGVRWTAARPPVVHPHRGGDWPRPGRGATIARLVFVTLGEP